MLLKLIRDETINKKPPSPLFNNLSKEALDKMCEDVQEKMDQTLKRQIDDKKRAKNRKVWERQKAKLKAADSDTKDITQTNSVSQRAQANREPTRKQPCQAAVSKRFKGCDGQSV